MPRAANEFVTRMLKGAGAGGALAGLAAGGLYYQLLRRPLPRTSGSETVAGLEGRATISRDRWGVPHVHARSLGDLWFAQGWAHAQDRLAFMDLFRRLTCGRLSDIAGPDGIASDRLMLTLGFRRQAEREAAGLDPAFRAHLEAYCAGVNAGVEALDALPLELQLIRSGFDPWAPVDMLTTSKLLAFGLSTNWERELLRADLVRELGPEIAARIDPTYPAGNPVCMEPGIAWSGRGLLLADQIGAVRDLLGVPGGPSGSNNWVVSGERTVNGRPLIAGDPHLPSSMPGIWYQASLQVGTRFARGATVPGTPGIWMGQSNDVAWSFTNAMADVMDLYVERLDGDTYELDGEWQPLDTRTEQISVRGASDVTIEVRETHRGPLVNSLLGADDAEPLSLAFTALRFPTFGPQQTRIMELTDGETLCEAFRDYHMPVSNLLWADSGGNIGYRMVGSLPIRAGGSPDLPKPGWTSEFDWDGYVPFDEMPAVTNPEKGFLVTANNRMVGEEYPHHVTSDWLDGYRALRIEQLIEAREEHDIESFREMQCDMLSLPGLEVAHRLARLAPTGQREQAAIERLRSWDGRLDPETIAGTIYQAFTLRLGREFCRAVIRDRDLSDRWLDGAANGFLEHVTSPWRWTSHLLALWAEGDEELIGRSWDQLALEALRGALDDLGDRFGPDPAGWQWGVVHELKFPHLLADANPLFDRFLSRSIRVGGGQETVCQVAFNPNDPFEGIWAPSWRMIADPGDPGGAQWQAFTGQSGHPTDGHYDDLMGRWLAGETQPMAGEGPWQELELLPDRGPSPG